MNNKQSFYTQRYLIQSVDPVHIGTGGMHLGRVDNSIVREPGTKLPKIPGTSLSGAIRSYAAYRNEKRDCAGQKGHCGKSTCPICYTFGSISDDSIEGKVQNNYAGVVSIGDARIILFPVYSMAGPVWVTCPSAVEDFCIQKVTVKENMAKMASGLSEHQYLNLGWLMLEKDGENGGKLTLDDLPSNIAASVKNRIVLISDKLFSRVVNSNLEVRTSVSIDPKTGAAEEGALFTYEAIPRAAFLWLDIVVDDYRDRKLWQNKPNGWCSAVDVVTAGLEWTEHLGIGGMGTRGFGRIRKVAAGTMDTENKISWDSSSTSDCPDSSASGE
jgi:CRISPR-associated protein Cmr4